MGRLQVIVFILMLLSLASVHGLTQEERAYFDQQNQRTVSQINSKIDTQVARVEQNVQKEVGKIQNEMQQRIHDEINSAIKSLIIGVVGAIIVVMALFEVVRLRLSTTKKIDTYEKQLKEERDKIVLLRKQMEKEKELLRQKNHTTDMYRPPTPNGEKSLVNKFKRRRNLFIGIGIIVMVVVVVASIILYREFFMGL